MRMLGIYTKWSSDVWFGVACDEQSVFATSFAPNEQEALRSLLCSIPFPSSFSRF